MQSKDLTHLCELLTLPTWVPISSSVNEVGLNPQMSLSARTFHGFKYVSARTFHLSSPTDILAEYSYILYDFNLCELEIVRL